MALFSRLRGVRARTTLAATAVVAVALGVGSVVVVEVQRSLLEDDLDAFLEARAADLAALVTQAPELDTLQVRRQDEAFVQVVAADGTVVASSANVEGREPLVPLDPGIRTTTGLPLDADERFRVLVEPVDSAVLVVATSAESVDESLSALTGTLLVVIPSLVVVVAAVSWLTVGRALRPVESIRARVETISDADLDQRVPEPASLDEIGRLARTMNDMLDRLEASFLRQERFVADASHELKSPLTAMRTQLDVDLVHPETADIDRTRRILAAEIDQLRQLVDDLLYLARSDDGASLTPRSVDLDDIVFSEVERARALTDVAFDLTGVSAGVVAGERQGLTRLVRNLVDNAVRHATSRVTLSLSERQGHVVLAVADDGPGIPPEQRELVFERFARLDDARTRDGHGGTGLGLAIARAIAERHGGTLGLDTAHAPGARFVVDLPADGA